MLTGRRGQKMAETKQMLFARNLMCVCINANENAEYQGDIWTQYQDEPIDFLSVTSMLSQMDSLMDDWDFPQRALDQRHFYKNHNENDSFEEKDNILVIDRIQKESGTRNIQNKKGKLGTFVVRVAFRQNATWQGEMIHTEKNEKYAFDSAMEMLGIMDRCLKEN